MTFDPKADRRPLVSIVTPTFNRENYLRWTLRSVSNQTYDKLEHIVVDGNSTDGTVQMLREAEARYNLRWSSAPDDGMYAAINLGLARAGGDILAYLNSDDLYFPWTVETVVRTFAEHPDVDFVYGDAIAVDDDTGASTVWWMLPFDLDHIRRSGFLCQPTVFWRRSAFEALGPFDATLRYVADCDYWMRAGVNHRFLKINEFLAIERLHRGTLREAVDGPVWAELATVRSKYVTLSGPEHEARVAAHAAAAVRIVRRYTTRVLLQAFTPRRWRRGPWAQILNSGLVRVERFLYILRALKVGRVPKFRSWTLRDIIRAADRSILEPK